MGQFYVMVWDGERWVGDGNLFDDQGARERARHFEKQGWKTKLARKRQAFEALD